MIKTFQLIFISSNFYKLHSSVMDIFNDKIIMKLYFLFFCLPFFFKRELLNGYIPVHVSI